MNGTPWSPFFKDFLLSSGLRDSREGFRLQPTWPTWFPPAWIPIDHALVSSSVVVHDRRVGPNVGSDHYPVIIDFSISAKREAQKRGLAQRRKGRQVRRKYTNRRFTQMNADDNSSQSRSAEGNKSRQLSAISLQQDGKEKSKPRFDGREVMMGPRLRAKSKI